MQLQHRRAVTLAALLLLPLAAFGQEGRGSVRLTWFHDGANVGEWRLHGGRTAASVAQMALVSDRAARIGSIDGLASGDWFFAVSGVGVNGAQGALSPSIRCAVPVTGMNVCAIPLLPPAPVTNVVISPLVPPPVLTSQDIGAVGAAGSTALANGVYTIRASGFDIWGTVDEFRFAYLQVTGDRTITARVDSLAQADQWSKAGVMFRETLAANSRFAMTLLSGSRGVDFEARTTTGGAAGPAGQYDVVTRAPYWIRLRRVGNVFTGYVSADGLTWRQQGAATTVVMPATAYIGLAVTSHNDGQLATAAFSGLTVTQ